MATCTPKRGDAASSRSSTVGPAATAKTWVPRYSGRSVRHASPASLIRTHTRCGLVPVSENAPGIAMRLPHDELRRRERTVGMRRALFGDRDVEPREVLGRAGDDHLEAIAGAERAVVADRAVALANHVELDGRRRP